MDQLTLPSPTHLPLIVSEMFGMLEIYNDLSAMCCAMRCYAFYVLGV